MAHGDRRSLLSSHDVNAPLLSNNYSMAGMKQSKGLGGSSRASMIPRQSVLPSRVPSSSGQENNMLNAPGRASVGPRSSMAVGMGHPVPNAMGDVDMAGSSSATPYRNQAAQSRRVESVGRMSTAPTPNTRKSMGGRQSLAPRAGVNMKAQQAVDPRPIREDRHMLLKMENDIQDFLTETGFVFPAKYSGEFHMPSQVLVMGAFRHIYHQCIDLKHIFVAEPKKEIEEVMLLMTETKYPLLGDMSKTKLSAPGSIHNWPPICAMLHWMISAKDSLELPMTKYHGGPLERPVSDEDEDFCHYFPYLWSCYEQFWDSKDEYPEEKAKLEEMFQEKSSLARRENSQLLELERKMASRVKELEENEAPLKLEEKEKDVLMKDIKIFEDYRRYHLDPKILQYEKGIEDFRRESNKHEDRLHRLSADRDTLQEEVDAQKVSANDFEQLSLQREQLNENLKRVLSRLQDQSSENNNTEISLSNKQSRVEEELKDLSDKCRDLGMFPYTLPEGGQLFDFDIVAGNTNTMLPKGLDLRNGLKRRLGEKREKMAALYQKVMKDKVDDQEECDVIMEFVGEKREEVTSLETKVKSLNEQTEDMKQQQRDSSLQQAQVEADNESTLTQVDQASRNTLDQAEKRLQSAQMQINQVYDRDAELRDELLKEYTKGLETIFSLKTDVAERLQAIEDTINRQSM